MQAPSCGCSITVYCKVVKVRKIVLPVCQWKDEVSIVWIDRIGKSGIPANALGCRVLNDLKSVRH